MDFGENNAVENYSDVTAPQADYAQDNEPNYDNAQPTVDNSGEIDINQPMDNGGQPTMAVRTDPRTGRREIVYLGGDNEQTLQSTGDDVQYNQDANNIASNYTGQNQVESPSLEYNQYSDVQDEAAPLFNDNENTEFTPSQPYKNAGELMQAINDNSIDENRIPMELAFQYAAYKQQFQANQQQQTQASDKQEEADRANMEQQRYQFYSEVDRMAREAAMKDLGLTEEQLELAEYSDDPEIQEKAQRMSTVLQYHTTNILNQVAQKQAEQRKVEEQRQAVYNNIRATVESIRANEKEFDNINNLMGSMYKSMPYAQAVKYAEAVQAFNNGSITDAQAIDLKEYYDKARVAYYARKNGRGTVQRPLPMTVTPGNDIARQEMAQRQGVVSAEDIRNASTDYRKRQAVVQRWLMAQEAKNR